MDVIIRTKEIEIWNLAFPLPSELFRDDREARWFWPTGNLFQPGHMYVWYVLIDENPYPVERTLFLTIHEKDGTAGTSLSIIQDGKPEELL